MAVDILIIDRKDGYMSKKGNKEKGFTLVELLAVIVILAVILVISVPKITDTIESSRLAAIESTARTILNSAERTYAAKLILDENYSNNKFECKDVVELSESDYDVNSCEVKFTNNVASINLTGKGKFEGYTCTGTKEDLNCSKENSISPTESPVYYAWMDETDKALENWTSTETDHTKVKFDGENKTDLFLGKQDSVLFACISNGESDPLCVPSNLLPPTESSSWSEMEQEAVLKIMEDIFGSNKCKITSDFATCGPINNFYCVADSEGNAYCATDSLDAGCSVTSDGLVACFKD